MKISKTTSVLAALTLVSTLFIFSACAIPSERPENDSSLDLDQEQPAGIAEQDQEQDTDANDTDLSKTRIEWCGYTMGIDLVTDDQEKMNLPDDALDGKELKICFTHLYDENNLGGFSSESIFDDLERDPIVLKDTEGNTYAYLGSIGHIIVDGVPGDDDFGLAKIQPRFSISFDIPLDSAVEDYTLVIGDDQEITLTPYISEAYTAEYGD